METLKMSPKERRRLEVMSRVRDGELSLAKGTRLLGLSVRQGWRLWKRYAAQGDAGLVHGLRGKVGNRATKGSVKASVLKLYREKYGDFGPTLACEHLSGDGMRLGSRRCGVGW